MKKAGKNAKGQDSQPSIDDDGMLSEYDFSKMVPISRPRRFREGDRVDINGAPFRVSGRGFVPESEYRPLARKAK
jgi:hypothetical protein